MEGVSATFYVAASKWLTRRYGDRTGTVEEHNELIRALGDAERAYQRMRPYAAPAGDAGPQADEE